MGNASITELELSEGKGKDINDESLVSYTGLEKLYSLLANMLLLCLYFPNDYAQDFSVMS